MRAAIVACLAIAFAANATETMRIAMDVGGTQVEISSRDLALGDDTEEGPFVACNSPASVRAIGGQLVVDGVSSAKSTVRFRGGIRNLDRGTELSRTEPIRVRGLTVRGDVVVRVEQDRLRLINVIPLEDYLVAVLGSEMPPSFPLEALKAQAVAARTYALFKKIDAYGEAYHLGSSVLHQVYGGLGREALRTRQAVRATAGEVLTYDLAPIEAYFHASCGGKTESGESALNRPLPYLQPVECPCGKSPVSRWELILRDSELASFLGLRDVHNVLITSRSETGRVRRIAAKGRSWNGVSFRERIGYTRLKSLSFDVRSEGEKVHFIGRGLGHGAGLCQWGAKIYAEEGWDYRQILAHYYPGTELQRLY